MTFAASYLDRVYKSLSTHELKEYKIFAKLRAQFRDGCLDIPYLPTIKEITEEDEDADDKFLSEWIYNYNIKQCNKILYKRKVFFMLENKYEVIENSYLDLFISNMDDNEKITTHFELNKIIQTDSKDLSIEEFKLYFALNKVIGIVHKNNNFKYKINNNLFLNLS